MEISVEVGTYPGLQRIRTERPESLHLGRATLPGIKMGVMRLGTGIRTVFTPFVLLYFDGELMANIFFSFLSNADGPRKEEKEDRMEWRALKLVWPQAAGKCSIHVDERLRHRRTRSKTKHV